MKFRNRTIWSLFTTLGIEEVWQRNMIVNNDEFHWHKEDFNEGGKMEKFAHYTIARFEDEFCCCLWFC